ncbi:hypothetical protein [Micromonospora sp. NPDC093277]|uniref:hypothetical protein n=1 Tax=Micromonospora sp. NPDC093277 TaxID=3364291 RepID=UPI0038201CD4
MVGVPALAFWEPTDLVAQADPDKVRVNWSGRPVEEVQKPMRYSVTAMSGNDANDVVWVAEDMRPGGALDARAVGDLHGYLRVTATAETEGSGTKFTTFHDSQSVGLVGVLGPPRSRGTGCAADKIGRCLPIEHVSADRPRCPPSDRGRVRAWAVRFGPGRDRDE